MLRIYLQGMGGFPKIDHLPTLFPDELFLSVNVGREVVCRVIIPPFHPLQGGARKKKLRVRAGFQDDIQIIQRHLRKNLVYQLQGNPLPAFTAFASWLVSGRFSATLR